jgi:predicted metalloprotease with PDZ domain
LDFEVREASHGQASLREVFQWMNQNYAKQGRFFPDSEGVREAAEAVSHTHLDGFFAKYVSGTQEIPWDDFFRAAGLHLVEEKTRVPDAGFVASRNFDGPMTVETVAGGGEAERAGLQTGDTILEIDGKIAGQESSEEISGLAAGNTVTVKVRGQRGVVRELKWKVGSREELAYQLTDMENVTPEQRSRRAAWLKGEAQIRQEPPSR